MRDNTVMKLSDKKTNEIRVIAKYLREQLTNYESFPVMRWKNCSKVKQVLILIMMIRLLSIQGIKSDVENQGEEAPLLSGFLHRVCIL